VVGQAGELVSSSERGRRDASSSNGLARDELPLGYQDDLLIEGLETEQPLGELIWKRLGVRDRSIVLASADSNVGKSALFAAVGVAFAHGIEIAPGAGPDVRRRVLLVSQDQHRANDYQYYYGFARGRGITSPNVFIYNRRDEPEKQLHLANDHAKADLLKYVDVVRPGVVVFDSLGAIGGVPEGQANPNAYAFRAMSFFRDLTRRGATVFVLLHPSPNRREKQWYPDARAYKAAADLTWQITKIDDGGKRLGNRITTDKFRDPSMDKPVPWEYAFRRLDAKTFQFYDLAGSLLGTGRHRLVDKLQGRVQSLAQQGVALITQPELEAYLTSQGASKSQAERAVAVFAQAPPDCVTTVARGHEVGLRSTVARNGRAVPSRVKVFMLRRAA
jgi:hypothetical protein